MTVELWYGSKPRHASEQQALVELYQFLMPQQEHFVLLLNFYAGQSNEIDLAAIKSNGIFLVELKHVGGRLIGKREGDWKIIESDGTEVVLNPGRPNPFKQIKYNYWHFRDWCQQNAQAISAGIVRPQPVDYGKAHSLVVIYPDLHPESKLDIGKFPVQAMGFPKFMTTLVVRTSPGLDLSRQEMCRIPHLLQLTEWTLLPPIKVDPHKTLQLAADWQPPEFAVLVARGHELSVPLFKLDAVAQKCITVGREPDNDLIIDHRAVSRHHAEIRRVGERYVVRDLGSTSGTFVSFDGDPAHERNISNAENALKNHSIVRFGPASYTFLSNP
ncbi:MAG: FHA domain-containing protein [Anaerolineae bacterium]|nr:FHA domain-containing protein [Anaerolineae bacterium]